MNARAQTLGRLVLGAVLLVAGAMKLVHPGDFFADLLDYRVPLPEMFWRVVAVALPCLEVLTGLGLILDFWPETIRPLISLLCLGFVVMLGQAVVRGFDLSCGCFGAGGHGWFERPDVALVRAVFLFAVSLYVAAAPATRPVAPVA